MLSPRALQLLIRHFDAIDKSLSLRLLRKRPWPEEALTALLCDLLDGDTQGDEVLSYPLADLLADLARTDEPLGFRVNVETLQYPSGVERYVTQSDLGMIVSYQDQFEPRNSFSLPWLLQAKRLFHTSSGTSYGLSSAFDSHDADQHQRMQKLRDWAGHDFIRYLLYCPRPAGLSQPVREALTHHRAAALADHIFDYNLGLQLREDLLSDNPSVAAGVFVALLDHCPKNLGEVHRTIFQASRPLAWFLVEQFGHLGRIFHPSDRPRFHPSAHSNLDVIERLVRGDHRVLRDFPLRELFDVESPPKILPKHTLRIEVVCGIDRPRYDTDT